jgi:hypothetical protein
MNQLKASIIPALLCGAALVLLLAACGESATNVNNTATITKDAAESIAGDIAYSTGGTIDQLIDLSSFATAGGLDNLEAKYPGDYFDFQRTYDPVTGQWTIHIERERGTQGQIPYAFVSRDYLLQYLDAGGLPQQYYITNADTARTILFQVVQGEGRHVTRRLSQQLNQLSANWTVTNANQSILTINGTYFRAAVDTIRTVNRLRASDHNLQLNVSNLTLPRGSGPTLVNAISGHITGHFHADITFISGTSYNEHTIDRDIDILIGSGRADIAIDDKTYQADLLTGELLE